MGLIDADNLNFQEQHYNKSQIKAILDFVDAQPTAYDVDKVVEQLKDVSYERFENAGMGGENVVNLDDASVLHSPTKWLAECILSGRYFYDENLMLEINFQNARCTEDTNLNKYVNKKKSEGKVDQVVGNITSTYLIEQDILYNTEFFVQII